MMEVGCLAIFLVSIWFEFVGWLFRHFFFHLIVNAYVWYNYKHPSIYVVATIISYFLSLAAKRYSNFSFAKLVLTFFMLWYSFHGFQVVKFNLQKKVLKAKQTKQKTVMAVSMRDLDPAFQGAGQKAYPLS